ncbi:MAG: hypothetical protein QM715_03675 [Nibricoccus sp.]
MLLLAIISLLGGIAVWTETENGWSVVPFVVFTFLFCLSLFVPVLKKSHLMTIWRATLKASKIMAEWLGAMGHYSARYVAQKRFEIRRARHEKALVAASLRRSAPPPVA